MTSGERAPSPSTVDDGPTKRPRVEAPAALDHGGADTGPDDGEHLGTGTPSGSSGLALLRHEPTLRGTVWIPRILWALEWGRREGRPPLSAADVARVLTEHGGVEVARHNVARAFRDFRNDATVTRLWVVAGRGYEITEAGTRALKALLADDRGA